MSSFSFPSFEYKVRSLNITNIESYGTSQNVLFMSYNDPDPGAIDLTLCSSLRIPFEILYACVIQSNIFIYIS